MDQSGETAAGELQERNAADPADSDLMQAASPDGEPRIENSLGKYHHQR